MIIMRVNNKMSTKDSIVHKNKDIVGVFVVTGLILMIPLVAMQFTEEVDWNLFDFVVMGILMIGTGLLMVLATRRIKNRDYQVVTIIALLVLFLLVWAEGAVGVFGSPFAGS